MARYKSKLRSLRLRRCRARRGQQPPPPHLLVTLLRGGPGRHVDVDLAVDAEGEDLRDDHLGFVAQD